MKDTNGYKIVLIIIGYQEKENANCLEFALHLNQKAITQPMKEKLQGGRGERGTIVHHW